jgi:hypothetical protein
VTSIILKNQEGGEEVMGSSDDEASYGLEDRSFIMQDQVEIDPMNCELKGSNVESLRNRLSVKKEESLSKHSHDHPFYSLNQF